ncbi:Hypothetical predicted protein, partial [Scomber scombrus]
MPAIGMEQGTENRECNDINILPDEWSQVTRDKRNRMKKRKVLSPTTSPHVSTPEYTPPGNRYSPLLEDDELMEDATLQSGATPAISPSGVLATPHNQEVQDERNGDKGPSFHNLFSLSPFETPSALQIERENEDQ